MSRVLVMGVPGTIRMIDSKFGEYRADKKTVFTRITEDFLRKAQAMVPLDEGTLAASGSAFVQDNGLGKGMIGVVGFATPYALRMHEDRYQARTRAEQSGRKRKGGRKGYKFSIATMSTAKDITDEADGSGSGFAGKRGRKYLVRAWWSNRNRYRAALETAGK